MDARNLHQNRFKLVAAANHEACQRRDRGGEKLAVRSDVGDYLRSDSENRAVIPDRNLAFRDLVTPVDGGCCVFAPTLYPFDWPVEAHREMTDYDLFGVKIELRTEAAADLRGHHTQLVLRDANEIREQSADEVWDLGRSPERERRFPGMPQRRAAAWLNRHGRYPR